METILKAIMIEKGLSQNRLSQLTRIPASNISLIVNGKMPVYPAWRKRICEALGVPEKILFPNLGGQ